MYSPIRRAFALLLIVCLFVPVSANAEEYLTDSEDPNDALPVYRSLVFPDIYDGGGVVEHLLFSMALGKVYNTVNTSDNNAKCFYKGTLQELGATKVSMQGTLYYSAADSVTYEDTFRAGIAYYNLDAGVPLPAYYRYPTSGVGFYYSLFNVSSLDANTHFFGFVTNLLDVGYITGNLAFYYS